MKSVALVVDGEWLTAKAAKAVLAKQEKVLKFLIKDGWTGEIQCQKRYDVDSIAGSEEWLKAQGASSYLHWEKLRGSKGYRAGEGWDGFGNRGVALVSDGLQGLSSGDKILINAHVVAVGENSTVESVMAEMNGTGVASLEPESMDVTPPFEVDGKELYQALCAAKRMCSTNGERYKDLLLVKFSQQGVELSSCSGVSGYSRYFGDEDKALEVSLLGFKTVSIPATSKLKFLNKSGKASIYKAPNGILFRMGNDGLFLADADQEGADMAPILNGETVLGLKTTKEELSYVLSLLGKLGCNRVSVKGGLFKGYGLRPGMNDRTVANFGDKYFEAEEQIAGDQPDVKFGLNMAFLKKAITGMDEIEIFVAEGRHVVIQSGDPQKQTGVRLIAQLRN